jgi:hypothetical protein
VPAATAHFSVEGALEEGTNRSERAPLLQQCGHHDAEGRGNLSEQFVENALVVGRSGGGYVRHHPSSEQGVHTHVNPGLTMKVAERDLAPELSSIGVSNVPASPCAPDHDAVPIETVR